VQATKPVKDPRKQRKRLYTAPAHLRHRFMAAPLSPELVSSRGVKSLPVRKGDTVRIVRGDHIGFEGKVNRVDLKKYRIFLEGLTREKVDGTNIFVSVHPSKVMIRSLKLDDKWRKAVVEFKKEQVPPEKEKKAVKVVEKRQKKAKEEKPVKEEVEAQEKLEEKAPKPEQKTDQKKLAVKITKKEKPVKKSKAATEAKEKLPEKKLAAKPKTALKKPTAAKKEKTVAKKKMEPAAKNSSLKKGPKPKVVKKAPAKRKTSSSKKEGGT
jgi:large subunit ribosomal protein L24